MLPPIRVCKPPPIVPMIERERTTIPRVIPLLLVMRYPGSSNAVVSIVFSILIIIIILNYTYYRQHMNLMVFSIRKVHQREGAMADGEKVIYCSFCGKSHHETLTIVTGPEVAICNECVELCASMMVGLGIKSGGIVELAKIISAEYSEITKPPTE
jgi:hypothetical protein